MATILEKYGVVHRVATAYHPKTNDQAELIKSITHSSAGQPELTRVNKRASVEMKSSRPDRLRLGQARFVSAVLALRSCALFTRLGIHPDYTLIISFSRSRSLHFHGGAQCCFGISLDRGSA
ncbi:hypothetical protein CR513_43271, partial [Mucuna pruriens]